MFIVGQFTVKDVKPTPDGESAKVKVKVRINLHGILAINSASLVEKLPASESDVTEDQSQPDPMEASPSPQTEAVNGMENEPMSTEVILSGSKRNASHLECRIPLNDAQKLYNWFYSVVCVVIIFSSSISWKYWIDCISTAGWVKKVNWLMWVRDSILHSEVGKHSWQNQSIVSS